MAVINNMPQQANFNNATEATDGLMSRNDKQKLDTLHAAKTFKFNLLASGWTQNSPYTQTIKIDDMSKDVNGSLFIDQLATTEQIEITADAGIIISEQSIGYLTLQVTGKKPSIDLPMAVIFGENLAVLTPPKLVDTTNRSIEITINPTEWIYQIDRYIISVNLVGITENSNGTLALQSGVTEEEAWMVAKARIEIYEVKEDTITLECRGIKPDQPVHMLILYGPSINVIEVAKFGGKITPEAKYTKYDDSKTGLQATNVQTAIENMVLSTTGLDKKPTHFKTIATLKECMTLQAGQLVITSGYYTENDGGGTHYIITANTTKEDNGGSVHVLKNKLRAELLLPRGESINLKTFGMYADEWHDDAIAFNRAFDYCKEIKGGTITWQGKCAIKTPLVIDSHYININGFGSNSIIKAVDDMNACIIIDYGTNTDGLRQINLKNFRLDAFRHAQSGMLIGNNTTAVTCLFENIYVENSMGYALILDATQSCDFNMIHAYKCHGSVKIINGASDNTFSGCNLSNAIINSNILIGVDKNYNGFKPSMNDNIPCRNRFMNCSIGSSENDNLIDIRYSRSTEFINNIFELSKTLCDDYAILITVNNIYTKFTNCKIDAKLKTCGLFKNDGHDSIISDFVAIDSHADIHVLSSNAMNVDNFTVSGDTTPLVIYSTSADPTIVSIDRAVKKVNDENVIVPTNANFYNMYINNKDQLGIKGKLDDYVLDKRLLDELIIETFTLENANEFNIIKKLPLEGVWEITLYMYTDDKNQGSLLKYMITFKQNSVYNVLNIQKINNIIAWGFGLLNTEPTIDEFGNFAITYKDEASNNRGKWVVSMKAERVMPM